MNRLKSTSNSSAFQWIWLHQIAIKLPTHSHTNQISGLKQVNNNNRRGFLTWIKNSGKLKSMNAGLVPVIWDESWSKSILGGTEPPGNSVVNFLASLSMARGELQIELRSVSHALTRLLSIFTRGHRIVKRTVKRRNQIQRINCSSTSIRLPLDQTVNRRLISCDSSPIDDWQLHLGHCPWKGGPCHSCSCVARRCHGLQFDYPRRVELYIIHHPIHSCQRLTRHGKMSFNIVRQYILPGALTASKASISRLGSARLGSFRLVSARFCYLTLSEHIS